VANGGLLAREVEKATEDRGLKAVNLLSSIMID
jgi:hypothetical protein